MTANYYDETPGTSRGLFLIILLCAALTVGLAVALITYNSHAVERHGDAAVIVRHCMNENGPIETWLNPDNGREAHICEIDNSLYGIQVEENGQEVTSFLKEKLRDINQVRQYLQNRGYSQ